MSSPKGKQMGVFDYGLRKIENVKESFNPQFAIVLLVFGTDLMEGAISEFVVDRDLLVFSEWR